jgi:hypothetical protein
VAVIPFDAARQRGHFDVSLMCEGEILVEWESVLGNSAGGSGWGGSGGILDICDCCSGSGWVAVILFDAAR